jgi:glyoxylase-like metal-dependent hydrolase (beta-lactamase superfamily II)
MRIHHLNCGLMRPLGGALFDGYSPGLTARLTCHCLLIETERSLVLVDTGFGLRDMRTPYQRLSPLWLYLDNIELDERLTAVRQVEALGYDPRDVRHIVMTHLDFDHAGGLEDFPEAAVHVRSRARSRAQRARADRAPPLSGRAARRRCATGRPIAPGGEPWHGFRAVRELHGLPPEIVMVALSGPYPGHAGVAIGTATAGCCTPPTPISAATRWTG